MFMRRILGLIMLLTGLTILVLALIGAYYAGDTIGKVAEGLSSNLTLAVDSLDTAADTLELSRNSLGDVVTGLDTIVAATANASRTLNDSRPLIDNVAIVTSQEVPETIEGMQAALPNLIEVASVVDATLTTLSSIGIDQDIPLPFGGSIPLRFDLGINYNPTTSFDESLRTFEGSLEGLPESLRGLEDELQATNASLATMSNDLQATSDNLSTINAWIADTGPLLDQYIGLIDRLRETLKQAGDRLDNSLRLVRFGSVALLVTIGLTQLAPIYLGWELLTGRRDPVKYEHVTPSAEEDHGA
ncbi:MAG TPA: hypothetical protein PKJ56_00770 [Promineifilum sp.]|nr:hypothetical protein [Promineifilum sp.]